MNCKFLFFLVRTKGSHVTVLHQIFFSLRVFLLGKPSNKTRMYYMKFQYLIQGLCEIRPLGYIFTNLFYDSNFRIKTPTIENTCAKGFIFHISLLQNNRNQLLYTFISSQPSYLRTHLLQNNQCSRVIHGATSRSVYRREFSPKAAYFGSMRECIILGVENGENR